MTGITGIGAAAVNPSQAMMDLQAAGMRNLSQINVPTVRSIDEARRLYEEASTPEAKKIKKTADEFVSILYGMLFKEMDKTVERTGLMDGGQGEEMFRSFVLDEYAQQASSTSGSVLNHRVFEMLYEANSKRVKPAPAAK